MRSRYEAINCWRKRIIAMTPGEELVVVRLGHRPGRDDRITTHVGLTARALGADRFVLVGTHTDPLDQIDDVTARFGGSFSTETADSFQQFRNDWGGHIIHLTMYGLPVQEEIESITTEVGHGPVAVVVGAEKVPFSVYESADWNIAITNQPHSEVASVAICLRELLGPASLTVPFHGGTHQVRPRALGKEVDTGDDAP